MKPLSRIWSIIKNPKQAFTRIPEKIDFNFLLVFSAFFYLVFLVSVILTYFLGVLAPEDSYFALLFETFNYLTIIYFIVLFVVIVLGMLLLSLILSALLLLLSKLLNKKIRFPTIINIIIYSLVPQIFSLVVSFLFNFTGVAGLLVFNWIFYLYSIVLIYYGVKSNLK